MQKLDERRRHASSSDEFVMQMDGVGGEKLFRCFKGRRDAHAHVMSTPREDRCFYETIFDVHLQKPKFDIDIKVTKIPSDMLDDFHINIIDTILSAIQRNIPWMNPNDDIAVYQSHGSGKYSYHIVLCGFYVLDNNESSRFSRHIINTIKGDKITDERMINLICECIDLNVYKSLQQFRLLHCSKRGKDRFKERIYDLKFAGYETNQKKMATEYEEFEKSLIVLSLPLDSSSSVRRLDMSLYNGGGTEEAQPTANISSNPALSPWWIEAEEVLSHIQEKHLPKPFATSFYPNMQGGSLVCLRCPSEGYYCNTCSRRHSSENPFIFLKYNKETKMMEIRFDCRRSEGKTSLLCSMVKEKNGFSCR